MRGFIIRQLLSRANSYMTYKSYGDAERIFCKMTIIDHNNINARIGLGMAYMQQGKYADAVPQFEFLVSFGKQDDKRSKFDYISYRAFSLKMLAACYQVLGDREKMNSALQELKKMRGVQDAY